MQASGSLTRSADRRILLIALGLGALAAIMTIIYLNGAQGETRIVEAIVPTRPVVVAREIIPAGEKIALNMIEVRAVPEAGVAADAIPAVEQVVGQAVRYPVSPGEQITRLRLLSPANSPAISFQIPQGMRAFTIPINASRSPVPLLAPGDFVDVLAILAGADLGIPVPGGTEGVVTAMQNVQVLAIDAAYVANGVPYDDSVRGAPTRAAAGTVTLAVTPDEAQFLTLLLDRTRLLTVALRPFADSATQELAPATGPIRITSSRPTLPQP